MTSKIGFTPLSRSPDIEPLSAGSIMLEKRGLTSKVASVFKRIQLYIQYGLSQINGLFLSSERRQLFKKNCTMKTTNGGRAQDIGKCVGLVSSPKFEQTAKRHSIQICNARFKLEPFSGACYGSSLYFSRRYLESGIEAVTKEFEGSQPYEAVLLQSCYDQISACTADQAAHETMSDLAGLASSKRLYGDCSLSTIITKAPTWEAGVYRIVFPIYDSDGLRESYHAVILVKEKEKNYLFEPNYGLGYEAFEENDLMNRMFTLYYGSFEHINGVIYKNSWSDRFKSNFFRRLRSTFGESDFTVERMALSPVL